MRVVVIGAGQFGTEHLRAYSMMPDVEIVGVMDADPVRARDVADRFETVALEPGPINADAVSLVVPVHARGALATELLALGGTALFIEKPLAASTAVAGQLERAAHGRVAMVGHVVRFAEPYRRLADASRGAPLSGHLSRRRSADHAVAYPSEDVIGLTMIHDLDAATWIAGSRPTSVSATGDRSADGRWTRCRAELRHRDGSEWVVEAEWSGDSGDQEDRARVQGPAGEVSLVITAAEADTVYGDALVAELDHFIDHVRSGTPSQVLRMGDAAFAVTLADAVRASLEQEGASVDLS